MNPLVVCNNILDLGVGRSAQATSWILLVSGAGKRLSEVHKFFSVVEVGNCPLGLCRALLDLEIGN
jgi:hypothetical protein